MIGKIFGGVVWLATNRPKLFFGLAGGGVAVVAGVILLPILMSASPHEQAQVVTPQTAGPRTGEAALYASKVDDPGAGRAHAVTPPPVARPIHRSAVDPFPEPGTAAQPRPEPETVAAPAPKAVRRPVAPVADEAQLAEIEKLEAVVMTDPASAAAWARLAEAYEHASKTRKAITAWSNYVQIVRRNRPELAREGEARIRALGGTPPP